MHQLKIFQDERSEDFWSLCGGVLDTRDHVPSKVLMDPPYPVQIPTVPVCYACNNLLSKDEEYFACAIDCVINGDARSPLLRQSTLRSFAKSPSLLAMIEAQRNASGARILW